ncbi:phage portal protein [Aeromicrobium piscarium]|uniref:Phage portal protein n=1 Tax=Aeromicrobium piscarium TaxID=2590901 RepID=A0A554SP31_9ACTN|nr:phage portal protein [Aeromicrobium piscarium]TSD68123.1 phage portal protein [Aeromicrobium piscarium]
MALTDSEVETLNSLKRGQVKRYRKDLLHERYREGEARIEHLGMAIPPEMRRFMVYINWIDTLVTSHTDRQQVRSIVLPGEDEPDAALRSMWDASNMDTQLSMFSDDSWTYGRSFFSVGTNESNADFPIIRAENPMEMTAKVNIRTQQMDAAARFYRDPDTGQNKAVLYLPDVTIWVDRENGKWVEKDRDKHSLGVVPVIMHLHRRRSGRWVGKPGISILMPLVDSVTRTMTNMQFGQEAAGIPRIFLTGVAQGDFVDDKGNPIPRFEAYWNALYLLKKENAKAGTLTPADLKNFETAVMTNGKLASSLTKLPPDYFGITTANPSTEGAIRGTESRLVRSVEAFNAQVGDPVGWTMALALRFATGEWVEGNRVRVDWFDPATPTVAQRMDAVVKAKSQGILSREGAWDELGWSEARKDKERRYFAAERAESIDPATELITRDLAMNYADPA